MYSNNNVFITQYIAYTIDNEGSNPTVIGTREITVDTNRLNGATILKNNRNWLVEQGIAWNDITQTAYTNIDKAWIRKYIELFFQHLNMI